jgi:hypothetical protein
MAPLSALATTLPDYDAAGRDGKVVERGDNDHAFLIIAGADSTGFPILSGRQSLRSIFLHPHSPRTSEPLHQNLIPHIQA